MNISELLKLQPWFTVHYDANQKCFICRSIVTGQEYFDFDTAEGAVKKAIASEPLKSK